jgi:hypothetical protein
MDYVDFDLEIGPGAGREYPVAAHSPSGDTRRTMLFPFDEVVLESRLKDLQIALLRSGGEYRAILSPEEQAVQDFGQSLFNAVFGDDVRSLYDTTRREARSQGKGVRLKLRVRSPQLAALPWEFLYDPRQNQYVCRSINTPIVRYLELLQPIQPLTVKLPLRILGMIVSPADLPKLDVEREQGRVGQAIKSLQSRGLVELHWLVGGTWRDLQRAMRSGPWHIFHFVGHGLFDRNTQQGIVALADEYGDTHRLYASQLALLLADHDPMRLAILNACEGGRSGERDIFSSTASILVSQGLPAVVAMQYRITDRAAIEFAQAFYESLADSVPVDAAVVEARKAISVAVANTVEWGTPVLYMRSVDGVLFNLKTDTEAERLARHKAEQERLARERAEQAARQAEAARLAREKAERERLAREQVEAERVAREKAEAERLAAQKAEAERLARERAEWERQEQEKAEAERIERERAEQERLRQEKARAEEELLAKEQADVMRIMREKEGRESVAQWLATHEAEEQERLVREQAESERLARTKAEREDVETGSAIAGLTAWMDKPWFPLASLTAGWGLASFVGTFVFWLLYQNGQEVSASRFGELLVLGLIGGTATWAALRVSKSNEGDIPPLLIIGPWVAITLSGVWLWPYLQDKGLGIDESVAMERAIFGVLGGIVMGAVLYQRRMISSQRAAAIGVGWAIAWAVAAWLELSVINLFGDNPSSGIIESLMSLGLSYDTATALMPWVDALISGLKGALAGLIGGWVMLGQLRRDKDAGSVQTGMLTNVQGRTEAAGRERDQSTISKKSLAATIPGLAAWMKKPWFPLALLTVGWGLALFIANYLWWMLTLSGQDISGLAYGLVLGFLGGTVTWFVLRASISTERDVPPCSSLACGW